MNQPNNTHDQAQHVNPVTVFGILTLCTIVEIALPLLHIERSVLVPLLLGISFTKAGLVAAYYMHLRYEPPIYTAIFLAPALFAGFLILTLAMG
ncbi:MAG: cytochrome C oxidase subunit IV family protein [Thermoflexales bacterium]|nr:cytochrome C oxidase subunit IV family protein [Thermoflexales bacterium]MCS7323926.1 cytochrome C oxidase subunit IV family protein [Thermoflexales bacterium]MDW8054414.1 cytochrome C oxidase subunit IV family protein [Anaerolineae bacterium]MDW8292780.1 cytochrome C oxidase subunit IV family protein [Anaerolineae bacterium]